MRLLAASPSPAGTSPAAGSSSAGKLRRRGDRGEAAPQLHKRASRIASSRRQKGKEGTDSVKSVMKASNKGQWYALPLFSRLGEPLHYVDVPFRRHTHQGGRPARVNSTSTCKRPASRRAATSRWPRRRPHRASRMTPESDGTEWGGATQRTTTYYTRVHAVCVCVCGGGINAPLLVYSGTQS